MAAAFLIILISCEDRNRKQGADQFVQPNILWLVAEDLSPYIPAFGDSTVSTPNLDRLAEEGVRYTNVYSVSGVCAPSRSAITTGMYPSSIGAHNMRTMYQQPAAKAKGFMEYEVVPPPQVRMVSQVMRERGYYCTNNAKEDYQFHPTPTAWDESSVHAHWRNRPSGKPFYAVFNFGVTHESNTWNPWHRPYDIDPFPPPRGGEGWWKQFEGKQKPLFVPDTLEVQIPPYLPDNEVVRQDIRRMYSNIVEMDNQVGLILDQMEADGLIDHTIIVWYTDHGGPLPRQKRLLYDSGLHVPMIIRYPDQRQAGKVDDQLISFIDFAPTLLSMANIPIPDFMQGQAFTGRYKAETERKYIHAAADRFDEQIDMIRAVRDDRFKYLKNFYPEKGYYLSLEYRERMASMQELLRFQDSGNLNTYQMQWFRTSKPPEELFDTEIDPHELHNLAEDPNYADKLGELREECDRWMMDVGDKGLIAETEIIESFWPGKKQPVTAAPVIKEQNGLLTISSKTTGASLGYKYPQDDVPWIGWSVYSEPLMVSSGDTLMVIAHRLGYSPSDTLTYIHP